MRVPFRCAILLCLPLWFCGSPLLLLPVVRAQKPPAVDRVVELIETLEQRIERARWNVRTKRGKLREIADPSSLVARKDFDEGWVAFERQTGRCRLELHSVLPWVHGVDPFLAQDNSFAFDNSVSRVFQRGKPGIRLPEKSDPAGEGVLSNGDAGTALNPYGENCGLAYFPPYFRGNALSRLVRAAKGKGELQVTAKDPATWAIRISDWQIPDGVATIDYSHGKGGVVVGATFANGKPLGVWQRVHIDLQELANGFWVPSTVRIVNTIDKSVREIAYTNVQVNEPFEDGLFTFDFPPGTRIIDHIQKKVYRAGAGIKDEQKAIREYMVSQGLVKDRVASSRFTWVLTFLGIGALLLLGGLLAVRRRWLGRTLLICALLLLDGQCWAQSGDDATTGKKGQVRMAQCGFRATVFALEYFEVKDYSVENVAAALAPSPEGITLSAIQKTLEAYGLKVR